MKIVLKLSEIFSRDVTLAARALSLSRSLAHSLACVGRFITHWSTHMHVLTTTWPDRVVKTVTWTKHNNSVYWHRHFFASLMYWEISYGRQKRRKEKQRQQLSKRSLVTDANRPKMKSSVQIVCAIGELNFNGNFFIWLHQKLVKILWELRDR
jgi:hypothetical protein